MNTAKEKAVVVGNESDGWNVEYFNHKGEVALRASCGDKDDAEELARLLNDAAWIETLLSLHSLQSNVAGWRLQVRVLGGEAMSVPMPECMAPDGAEPCAAYSLLLAENVLLGEVLNRAKFALLASIKGTPEQANDAMGALSLACRAHWDWQTSRISSQSLCRQWGTPMMPVDTCGKNVYICRVCAKSARPEHDWFPNCRNDVGRKACWFCGGNAGDLDLVLAPSNEGRSND